MERIALYPFDANMLPLVKHFSELQCTYEIGEIIALPGSGLINRDAAYACNQTNIGVKVFDALHLDSKDWTKLCYNLTYDRRVPDVDLLKRTIDAQKNILMFSDDAARKYALRHFSKAFMPSNIQFSKPSVAIKKDSDLTYKDIKTPIMLVGGLAIQSDVSEITTHLVCGLKKAGVSVQVLSPNPIYGLFGFHNYMSCYDARDADFEAVIIKLNYFVRTIENLYHPDMIVIEAPDSVIRFNSKAPNGFGILTYMLCQAAKPDYFICGIPCDLAQQAFVEALSTDFEIRLGSRINAVHLSNSLIDAVDTMQNDRGLLTFYADFSEVHHYLEKWDQAGAIYAFNAVADAGNYDELLKHVFS